MTEAAEKLAPFFLKHGYAFLYLFRRVLQAAVEKTTVPIMLIQAANDYSTAPSRELADEFRRLHKSHGLKIYPPVGQTAHDGHNFLYLAIPQWERDVFGFLDEYVKR